MKEVVLDQAITREFIEHLGTAGELQYYPDFARPFFRVDAEQLFIAKGVQGQDRLRLILCRDNIDKAQHHFVDFVALFDKINSCRR